MKKGKWFALKGINGLLGSLLAVMGFSACEEVADMYGAVHADYTIKGAVTNEADEPLPNIRIRTPTRTGPHPIITSVTNRCWPLTPITTRFQPPTSYSKDFSPMQTTSTIRQPAQSF